MSKIITITANSEVFEINEGTTLAAFLESRGQAVGRVVVELNTHALSPSESLGVVLNDNDSLEIVRIVAGG